jgi:hypothetical protein
MTTSAARDRGAALDHADPLEDGDRDALRVDLVGPAGHLPLNDCELFICGTHLNLLVRLSRFRSGVDWYSAHRLLTAPL